MTALVREAMPAPGEEPQTSSAQTGTARPGASIDRVTARGVGKRFGHKRALWGVDLEFVGGSLCALVGQNGAGKSTLLGVLSTLVRPSSGEVRFHQGEQQVTAPRTLRRAIGVLSHESFLYGELSAEENLELFGRLYELPDPAARAHQVLDEVGLESAARKRPVRTYSRGMVQRVALGRALLHRPCVLLLDEPFTGLDRGGTRQLLATLEAARARGSVVVVVSHELEPLAHLTSHVVVLRRGKIQHQAARPTGFAGDELRQLYESHAE